MRVSQFMSTDKLERHILSVGLFVKILIQSIEPIVSCDVFECYIFDFLTKITCNCLEQYFLTIYMYVRVFALQVDKIYVNLRSFRCVWKYSNTNKMEKQDTIRH